MILRAIAFSDRGQAWSEKLGIPVDRGIPVRQWAKDNFDHADALLFIGACGIAVRAIAPLVRDKTTDPAVVVMDEAGRHVISLLSGHIGGANDLAVHIAALTGATPVITTATDVNNLPAIDTWAVKNGMAIENPGAIRAVSSRVIAKGDVGVAITEREIKPPFPVTLYLRPRTLVIGAGCKRGVDAQAFEHDVLSFLQTAGVSLLSVRALASIDVKGDEAAFRSFCEKYRLAFETYDAATLAAVDGVFSHSDFVQKTVGVGNVCERAAVKASGGVLLWGKTVFDGATLALAGAKET
ncbi:MAG: cobalamin biosynthesis protein [Clostridia bacterium]|nr:cobalamin biosynthesis protein [Clostridia bacterium]